MDSVTRCQTKEGNVKKYREYFDINEEVTDRVTKLRKIRGYKNQASFAEALGMKEGNIKQREAHNVKYTIEDLIKVCNLFNVDLDYLLGKSPRETQTVRSMIEDVITEICEEYCKYPIEYADYEDMLEERCEKCPLNKL